MTALRDLIEALRQKIGPDPPPASSRAHLIHLMRCCRTDEELAEFAILIAEASLATTFLTQRVRSPDSLRRIVTLTETMQEIQNELERREGG